MDVNDVLTSYFQKLEGLPCWEFQQGFGSFLTLNFGHPFLSIRDGNPEAKNPRMRKRSIVVLGKHHIWIEQCEWRVVKDGLELAWSESDRSVIGKALDQMDSQHLISISCDFQAGTANFSFEGGASLETIRYEDFKAEDAIWHLYSGDYVISQLADGSLEHGHASSKTPQSLKAAMFETRLNTGLL
ncbi:MAG: hypothetical protein MRY59_00360 [Aquisalinus sp.]|nr:hypothetical protein [Aquisalinus sp.]